MILEKIVQKLPSDKILGQTMMGYADNAKSFEELRKIVLENALCGLIVGRSLLSSLNTLGRDLRELANAYRKAFGFSPILAVEYEGGKFGKLLPPATELPSQMGISATGDKKSAYTAGHIAALELRTLNINTNLAPVANLYSYGAEPDLEENSFGEDPDEVSEYVLNYIRGLRNGGMMSFVKYFPKSSQHPDVSEGLGKLYKTAFKPFQLAFKLGVEGVVIGQAPLPAVDSVKTPSFFSPKVIRIIRREMGFKNILLTDYLDGEGMPEKLDPKEATIRALVAGNSITVPSRKVGGLQDALEGIIEGTEKDKDFHDRIMDTALEVLSFKLRKLEKFKRTPEKTRGSIVNRTRAWKLFFGGITVAKGEEELPLRWIGRPLVVIANGFNELLGETGRKLLREMLEGALSDFNILEPPKEISSKRLNEIYRNTPSNTLLIAITYNTHSDGKEVSVLKKLIDFFRESVVISLGSPLDLTSLDNAKICVAAFTPSVMAVKAALKVLKDKSKPPGRLPIEIKL